MPDKISGERLARITEWLRERTRGECPFCGGRDWTIDDELGSLPAYQGEEPKVQLDRGYTLVLLTCEGCGFTAPFAAKKVAAD